MVAPFEVDIQFCLFGFIYKLTRFYHYHKIPALHPLSIPSPSTHIFPPPTPSSITSTHCTTLLLPFNTSYHPIYPRYPKLLSSNNLLLSKKLPPTCPLLHL
jgi:hypothetical protein